MYPVTQATYSRKSNMANIQCFSFMETEIVFLYCSIFSEVLTIYFKKYNLCPELYHHITTPYHLVAIPAPLYVRAGPYTIAPPGHFLIMFGLNLVTTNNDSTFVNSILVMDSLPFVSLNLRDCLRPCAQAINDLPFVICR